MLSEWKEAGLFLLTTGVVLAGGAAGWRFAGRTPRLRHRRWAFPILAALLMPAPFAYWVWPTPWRVWEQSGTYYRRNVFTGERQELRECGCAWLPVTVHTAEAPGAPASLNKLTPPPDEH